MTWIIRTFLSWFQPDPRGLCLHCNKDLRSSFVGIEGGQVEAWVDDKPVCRSCCRQHGIKQWYHKEPKT